jgi:carboxypeptidase Q
VGWTNEENGGRGGTAYAAKHANETIFAIESDSGASTPTGFNVMASDAGYTMLSKIGMVALFLF